MENSSRKKYILTSGILYIIFGGINLILSLVVLCNNQVFETVNKYLVQYFEFYYEVTISVTEISEILKTTIITSLVFGVLSVLFGLYFILVSKKWTEETFKAKKTQFVVMTIISFFLCGNIITLIFLILALYEKKENKISSQQTMETSQNINDDAQLKMLEEIEKLKKLKDSGTLTDEEYTELLSKIIK